VLNAELLSLAQHLQAYSNNPAVSGGLDRLTLTLKSLRSPLSFLTPVQSTCNYVSLFLRNTASTVSEPFGNGTALRFDNVVIDEVQGGEAVPSSRPFSKTTPGAPGNNGKNGPIHVNPYPYTASPGQPHECAAGNEPYTGGYLIGNPPGKLPATTEKTTRPKG
jgi:hypothetical protein